jgi:hypothetical protein
MNIAAAIWGTVSMIAGVDLRTVQVWAHRIITMARA